MTVIFSEIVAILVAGIKGIALGIEGKMLQFARSIYLDSEG